MMTIEISHPHDWWYVWIVYDMTVHQPYQAIYDFHHNVRDVPWNQIQTEGATAGSSGFHPVVFVEAGGHRHLWGAGTRTTSWSESVTWWVIPTNVDVTVTGHSNDPIFDMMLIFASNGNVIPFDIKATWGWFGVVNVATGKAVFEEVGYTFDDPDILVKWRKDHPDFCTDGSQVSDTSNFRLNVERDMGDRWVWIYSAQKKDTTTSEVLYEGNNIYNDIKDKYLWPIFDSANRNTYLPWTIEETTNTVYEAWNSPTATRTEKYYNPTAGEFAKLLGDK